MYSLADAEHMYNKKTKEVITLKQYQILLEESTKGINNIDGIKAVAQRLGYDFCYKDESGRYFRHGSNSEITLDGLISGLTPTETKIANLIKAEGLTNRQIAERLGIAEGTIRTHMGRILIKLNIKSREDMKQQLRKILGVE